MSEADFFLDVLLPALSKGALISVEMIALAAPFGLLAGIAIATGRTYGGWGIMQVCRWYVILIKGCPLLLLLFIIYYGLPSLGIVFEPFVAAVIGFILCNGAYNSEYIRGAMLSVKEGQMTAAEALGMSRAQAIRYIILPQALRRAIPGISNEFIYLIKYSSLAYMITVIELTGAGKIVAAKYFAYFETFAVVGIFYLVLVSLATLALGYLERRLAVPGLMS
ncbi:amino acid ABC transporter permease [Methanofollis fontis]|uniref:Amino acid ABC transporter permease n=1 Tax=Methanofollis fontis TaxID=2052832 RepID=A0A483CQI9_9EURY|nr:amino acid ABC transporter permease [Methanofollis fontis]TAJ43421.1 amino acid ABC transporter permease [Methanofollis fontis]